MEYWKSPFTVILSLSKDLSGVSRRQATGGRPGDPSTPLGMTELVME